MGVIRDEIQAGRFTYSNFLNKCHIIKNMSGIVMFLPSACVTNEHRDLDLAFVQKEGRKLELKCTGT